MIKASFENMLTGGHPNSLGNTVQVVEIVLKAPDRFAELFNCYGSENPIVRLRTSNAMKRVEAENHACWCPTLIGSSPKSARLIRRQRNGLWRNCFSDWRTT